MTELGAQTPLSEVTVEGQNWMTALRAGRAELGQEGGVPTGASCAVAPDGKVTILDPTSRLRFVLMPDTSTSFRRAQPSGPRIPAETAPAKPAPVKPGASSQSQAASPQSQAASPQSQAASSQSQAASPQPQAASSQPQAASPQPQAASSQPQAASSQPGMPRGGKASKKTVAYVASPLAGGQTPELVVGDSGASPAAAAPEPSAEPARPQQPLAAPVAAQGQPPPKPAADPTTPEPAVSDGNGSVAGSAPESDGAVQPAPPWELLHSRDREPADDNPLRYRERTYVVPEGTSKDSAEAVARHRLAELRAELEDSPPGKFFNVAVFDHHWKERPKRPPLVTLQWKDWRGDTEVAYPLEEHLARKQARTSGPPPAGRASDPGTTGTATDTNAAADTGAAASTGTASGGARTQEASAPHGEGERPSTGEHDLRLAHAFEACQDLLFLATPAEALEFVVRLLNDVVPAEAITACLYDINTDEFRFVALHGPGGEERRGDAVPGRTGLFAAAAKLVGAPLRIDDLSADGRFDPAIDGRMGLEPRSALYLALNHQGRLLGMLQLLNSTRAATFTGSDADLLVYVGGQLAEFLHQARLKPHRIAGG